MGGWLLALGIAAALGPSGASALIGGAQVVAGPTGGILGVGNVALAPDGTGGVVWRQLYGGEAHVFVSQFENGSWGAPIEVDAGQAGPATSPAIAAGNGGELLVVWVAPWASESTGDNSPVTYYQLMSSVIQPGASGFGPPMQVDPEDVGTIPSGVTPSLAMAPDGSAYVVYRVVTNPLTPGISQPPGTISPIRPGDQLVDVRVAQFNGLYWSSLGAVNADPTQVTMRPPTTSNAPVIAIDRGGGAIVVWQEPDITGAARIWARRLYGAEQGFVLQASPSTINGKPVTVDADAPALSFGDYASTKVAFRLEGGAGSPFGTPELMVNTLADQFTSGGADFSGAQAIGGAASAGPPSISIDDNGDFQAGYTAGGATELVSGTSTSIGSPQSLGSTAGEPALATLDPDGGGATVWPSTGSDGQSVVDVRDALPDGGLQIASLSAPISGPISTLNVASAGGGSALVAFQQGESSTSQVVVGGGEAPPHHFFAFTPFGWIRPAKAVINWAAATSVIGNVTYSVLVDGQVKASGLSGLGYRLPARGLGEGVRHIQVIATDSVGQETLSPVEEIKIDGLPPAVTVQRLTRHRLRVRVYDAGSGARKKDTSIAFGDGSAPVRRKLTVVHRYSAPGRFRITVRCADKAGNRAVDRILVSVQ